MTIFNSTFRAAALSLCALATTMGLGATQALAESARLRISLDTNPSHVRNKGVDIFVEELQKRVGDRLTIEVYPSAQVFRDRDVAKALRQGALEMGVPGTWQLEGTEPSVAITALPMFYGADPAVTHTLMDGRLGDLINSQLESRLRVKVLGKWADAGSVHFYSTGKKVETFDDLRGMRIQYSGGSTFAARITGLGGVATMIPFSDLPMAMSQGAVDAIASSREGVRTAQLWDSGIEYSFEDYQFMAQYVPLISQKFWNEQPEDIREALVEAWDVAVTAQRAMVAANEQDARNALLDKGIEIVTPSQEEIVAARKQLMGVQDDLVSEMGINSDAISLALEELRAAGVEF